MAFNTAPGRAEYTASAAQTKFTFPFKIFNTSDVKVYLTPAGQAYDDAADILVETTDYTISINGDDGGDVNLTSGATLNDSITLVRALPITRDTEYQHAGDLTAEALNSDQEYQTYLVLDGASINERALVIPDSVQSFDTEIPTPIANKLLVFNNAADGFNLLDTSSTGFFNDAFIVESVAAMTGVDPNLYGSVIARGYYVANDGGGGLFNYDATQSAVNNGGTIIDGWVRQYSGAVSIKWFGAKGDGVTEDHVAIQSALDYCYGTGQNVKSCFAPSGRYIIGDTVFLPQIIDFYGEGVSIFTSLDSTRMKAKVGLEKDMFRVVGNLFTTYWWAGRIRDMDLRGDDTGTLGNGINLMNATSDTVTAQDGALFNNLIIEDFPVSGINLPSGSVPLHIRDVRVSNNGDYGISYTQDLALSANSLHLDNISGDRNTNGLVLLKDLDSTSNVLITNIKAEGINTAQDNAIIIDNCDRSAISISSGHTTSATPDGGVFKAPKDFIKIIGEGNPIVKWEGFAARIRTTDTEIDTSYVFNETVTGRTIHASVRSGSYNAIGGRRILVSGATISNGAGSNALIGSSGVTDFQLGDLVAGTQIADMLDVFCGEAYISGTDVAFRRQNVSGVDFIYASAYLDAFKVPDDYIRNKDSAIYDPASIANGATLSTTITTPCELGDLVMYSHAADQTSCIGTSHVSAQNTVTIHWLNLSGPARDIPSGLLTAYVMKESAFSFMNSTVYDPPSIATSAQSVVEMELKGAVIGDYIISSFSLDLQGVKLSAYVSAKDTVRVIFLNYTGAPVDLASGILKIGILNKN